MLRPSHKTAVTKTAVLGLGPETRVLETTVLGLGPKTGVIETAALGLGPKTKFPETAVLGLSPEARNWAKFQLGPNLHEPLVLGPKIWQVSQRVWLQESSQIAHYQALTTQMSLNTTKTGTRKKREKSRTQDSGISTTPLSL